MKYAVQSAAMFESRFNSVERILAYAKLKPEAPHYILGKQTPPEWPQAGVISYQNVVMKYRPELEPVLKVSIQQLIHTCNTDYSMSYRSHGLQWWLRHSSVQWALPHLSQSFGCVCTYAAKRPADASLPCSAQGVSFEVAAGEKVGIVGRTGSGKSSLIVTLFRIVEPDGGVISLDGLDLGSLGLNDVRGRIAAIPQDPVLFSGTVRSNLDPYGRHEDHELWEALGHVALKVLASCV